MLTCKDFLSELSDYLDEKIDAELRAKLESHITECPNCWVIADTTRKTIQIYKGMEPYPIPPDVESRLMKALEKKMAAQTEVGGSASPHLKALFPDIDYDVELALAPAVDIADRDGDRYGFSSGRRLEERWR